jgi:hypothetical protein
MVIARVIGIGSLLSESRGGGVKPFIGPSCLPRGPV